MDAPGVYSLATTRTLTPNPNPNPNPDQARFQRVMEALGVSADLKEKGAANGDLIMVSQHAQSAPAALAAQEVGSRA